MNFEAGCRLELEEWITLNLSVPSVDHSLSQFISPFPPPELMANVSGLDNELDFSAHGVAIYRALSEASSRPLSDYQSILDFGCGCGRLARMFKGHPGRIAGCDIDERHVNWINENLIFMEAKVSKVEPPIPYGDNEFEAVISISVFTHLTECSQDQFLAELHRVCRPHGRLFLTVHGQRALDRTLNEPTIYAMLNINDHRFKVAEDAFINDRHAFVVQPGHLTTNLGKLSLFEQIRDFVRGTRKMVSEDFEYGITFVSEKYVRSRWKRLFNIIDYRYGAIHDFQDVVVLEPI